MFKVTLFIRSELNMVGPDRCCEMNIDGITLLRY